MKRRPVKKGAFRTYFANMVRTRKQRASTAAMPAMPEVDGDVPNLGIARALVVILVIHVVAIAGIFAHSHWFEEPRREEAARSANAGLQPVRAPRDAATPLPRVADNSPTHLVTSGDTWASIAAEEGVTEEELRQRNGNIELSGGRILSIPPRTLVAAVPDELKRAEEGSVVHEGPGPSPDVIRSAEMVETTAVGSPVLVRPTLTRPTEAAAPAPTAEPVAMTPRANRVSAAAAEEKAKEKPVVASSSYTVKQGDTFWKIAKTHKTTPEAIMKANKISDAKKLKVGMQLRVP
ncbi:LysM peptidoglycan-binding domain-containing protein [Luteolibacter sp. Populi]|uniref:LysM peptidoglycan-binding domain-containing protein n=1 Tax=Luteolibacter sp. Populi TaxID=3230487 RepID=UPI00346578F2